jgi:hypothetical protein
MKMIIREQRVFVFMLGEADYNFKVRGFLFLVPFRRGEYW